MENTESINDYNRYISAITPSGGVGGGEPRIERMKLMRKVGRELFSVSVALSDADGTENHGLLRFPRIVLSANYTN